MEGKDKEGKFDKGNQFWKNRSSTNGPERAFATPEILYDMACEYFEHTANSINWTEQFWVGKNAEEKKKNFPTPFTLGGLCIFLGVNSKYFNKFEERLKKRDTKEAEDFLNVIYTIRDIIFTQKFEGAAVGIYKENIISKELGLTEKTEETIVVEPSRIKWGKDEVEI